MALPASGPLSLAQIQGEFGGSNPISMSEYYRGGGFVTNNNTSVPTSGTIAVSNFYGTVRRIFIPITISSSTYNFDVYANRGGSYVAGISDLQVTVNGGVRVGSTSTGAYAMLVTSSFAAGDTVTIVNNGVIQGMGGNGADSVLGAVDGGPGFGAGPALYINRPTTIQNNSIIAGGGGGGGAGGGGQDDKGPARWGGGGGGGAGFAPGAGGGGGYPGSAGTEDAGGSPGYGDASAGGFGGGRGAAGQNGQNSGGANPRSGGAGGAAGYYIIGNGFVTWTATGTREGPAA
jgi:hypothetical protein